MLPEEKRAGHQPVVLPPRAHGDGVPAIEASDLTRRFGDFTAVDRVNFQIQRGEIFGFLGSNGCGKTTTMKMLTGLLPASEGEAKIFGRALDAADLQTRRHVGYMSQSFSLYSELTVRQNLELHAHLFHLPAAEIAPRITEMLERFDLAAVADALPPALPLGVRQRLSLAVALIHKPDLLILDEPTSGVDPVARDEFWRYLIQPCRVNDGVTIFISTHFMHEAERCDRISLMHAGRVLAVGAPGGTGPPAQREPRWTTPSSPICRKRWAKRRRRTTDDIAQTSIPGNPAAPDGAGNRRVPRSRSFQLRPAPRLRRARN